MTGVAYEIASLTIDYSTVYLGADQRKQQRFASLAFVRGTQRWPVNLSHKGPVTNFANIHVISICIYSFCSVLNDHDDVNK